jgi:predicted polyphosphate/ATP-dependent NAD kinase
MPTHLKKVGLIVNPIAGMGGRVGLKGSDGEQTLRLARLLGAQPSAPGRVVQTLDVFKPLADQIELMTFPAQMGEAEARQAGFAPRVIGRIQADRTTAEDTRRAARNMAEMAVDLLLFAGGDGTARDIYEAVGLDIPVIGIPAGVKIHSGVYATNPAQAAQLAILYLRGRVKALGELEVMDIDEEAFRRGQVRARLYGYLKVPLERRFTQGAKAASAKSDHEALAVQSIAEQVVETMAAGWLYIVGSGTTPRAIMDRLNLKNTLLGIDAVKDGSLVAKDLNETRLLEIIDSQKTKIIVAQAQTPAGGHRRPRSRSNAGRVCESDYRVPGGDGISDSVEPRLGVDEFRMSKECIGRFQLLRNIL